MKQIVIGDVHGNEPRFMELMTELDVPASVAEREEKGINVIQLGDFLNLGYGQSEVDFYNNCRMFVDVMLVGNHELPAIAPRPQYVRFVGYESRDFVAEELWITDFTNASHSRAAFAVGDWLITHAGLNLRHENLINLDDPVGDIADYLNEEFEEFIGGKLTNPCISLFEDQDSIFWTRGVRAQYEGSAYGDPQHPLNQIIGHTPQVQTDGPHSYTSDKLYIIDIGAKVSLDNGIAALVTEDEGVSWELTEIAGVPQHG